MAQVRNATSRMGKAYSGGNVNLTGLGCIISIAKSLHLLKLCIDGGKTPWPGGSQWLRKKQTSARFHCFRCANSLCFRTQWFHCLSVVRKASKHSTTRCLVIVRSSLQLSASRKPTIPHPTKFMSSAQSHKFSNFCVCQMEQLRFWLKENAGLK